MSSTTSFHLITLSLNSQLNSWKSSVRLKRNQIKTFKQENTTRVFEFSKFFFLFSRFFLFNRFYLPTLIHGSWLKHIFIKFIRRQTLLGNSSVQVPDAWKRIEKYFSFSSYFISISLQNKMFINFSISISYELELAMKLLFKLIFELLSLNSL